MIRRPPRSTQSRSSAASDVYKRQLLEKGQKPLPAPPHYPRRPAPRHVTSPRPASPQHAAADPHLPAHPEEEDDVDQGHGSRGGHGSPIHTEAGHQEGIQYHVGARGDPHSAHGQPCVLGHGEEPSHRPK